MSTSDLDKKQPAVEAENDESDVELEGVDLDDDEPADEEDEYVDDDAMDTTTDPQKDDEGAVEREHEDHDEYEAARKERMELMASESKQVGKAAPSAGKASVEEQLQYLLGQSEVFAHFLAGKFCLDFCYFVDALQDMSTSDTMG